MGEAETMMGLAIQEGINRGTWKRSDLVISTKLFWGGLGPNDIRQARACLMVCVVLVLTDSTVCHASTLSRAWRPRCSGCNCRMSIWSFATARILKHPSRRLSGL